MTGHCTLSDSEQENDPSYVMAVFGCIDSTISARYTFINGHYLMDGIWYTVYAHSTTKNFFHIPLLIVSKIKNHNRISLGTGTIFITISFLYLNIIPKLESFVPSVFIKMMSGNYAARYMLRMADIIVIFFQCSWNHPKDHVAVIITSLSTRVARYSDIVTKGGKIIHYSNIKKKSNISLGWP